MLRHVPWMLFIAISTVCALRSGSLVVAISFSWSSVIDAMTFCGVPEPFGMPAALAMSLLVGGVFSSNVNDRSCAAAGRNVQRKRCERAPHTRSGACKSGGGGGARP